MSQHPQPAEPELAERNAREGDFATDHATAGFKASLPVTAGLASLGPVEGLDPDQVAALQAWQRRLEGRRRGWKRFKSWIRGVKD